MGVVVVKNAHRKEVVDSTSILPISSMAYGGYPRYSIMASNLGWSMEPIAYLKPMYVR